jgi:hypothetical protein
MLNHDQYWNWEVKSGDKVYYIEEDLRITWPDKGDNCGVYLRKGQVYEVLVPRAAPSGIVVKNPSTNEKIWGEHSWFVSENEWKNTKEQN